jgi:hypothetical protein
MSSIRNTCFRRNNGVKNRFNIGTNPIGSNAPIPSITDAVWGKHLYIKSAKVLHHAKYWIRDNGK